LTSANTEYERSLTFPLPASGRYIVNHQGNAKKLAIGNLSLTLDIAISDS
jgi:hypothetical protein